MNENTSIDINEILGIIYNNILKILLITILTTIILGFVTYKFVVRKYISTTKIYIVNKENIKLTSQDLELSNFLINDYKEIITSNDVIDEVKKNEGITTSNDKIKSNIKIYSPEGTRIIYISYIDNSSEGAKKTVQAIRTVAINKIKEITNTRDITILDEARIPKYPFSPSIKKIVIATSILVLILSSFFFVILNILNDKVVNPEDVEDKLKLPLLGVVSKFDKDEK